jgi:NAD(P)-dependent dehydrogenase (short-subunit alcohol dehydrogenase family)
VKIENAVVLVTGANRGVGLAFTRELLARGASKIYAGARDPATVMQTGVQPLRLDVTKSDDVAAAAELASDVTLVINNAGIAQAGGFLAPDSEEVARRIFETNFFAMFPIPTWWSACGPMRR